MTIRLYEAVIERRLRTDRGLAVDLLDVGNAVARRARENASGGIVNIRSGDLVAGIFVRPGIDGQGEFVEVGSDAIHRGFAYPIFLDENGRPWLSEALVDTVGVRRARRVT